MNHKKILVSGGLVNSTFLGIRLLQFLGGSEHEGADALVLSRLNAVEKRFTF